MAGTSSEPGRDQDRQGSEMSTRLDLADHTRHDPSLIVAYAAGDATGAELASASALVAGCEACGALHHDLRAIRAAMADLPVPTRPRDFRLTEEQAATLRPAGWRALVGALAGPRFRFAAPLGTAMATLGLAGLLLTSSGLSLFPAGGAATGSATRDVFSAAGAGPATGSGSSAGTPVPAGAENGTQAPEVAPSAAPAASPAPIKSAAPAATGMTTLSSSPTPAPVPDASVDIQGAGPIATTAPSGPVEAASPGAGDMSAGGGATAVPPEPRAPATSQQGGPSPAGATSGLVPLTAGLLLVLGLALGATRLIARRLV